MSFVDLAGERNTGRSLLRGEKKNRCRKSQKALSERWALLASPARANSLLREILSYGRFRNVKVKS